MKSVILLIFIFVFSGLLLLTGQDVPDKIIFSHKFHIEEVEAECKSCHEGALTSLQPLDNLQPEMETCYSCHDEEETDCGLCHTNPDEPDISKRYTNYKSNFPHQKHISDESNCLVCHSGIENQEEYGKSYVPGNDLCASCHESADYTEEKIKCLVCHEEKFRFVPADHRLNWKKDHGIKAQIASTSCNHCHQKHYCQTCHEGDNLDHIVHPLNFRYNHGLSARGNKENCLSCHQEQAFCMECHQIEMVMPKNHSYVNWSNRIPGNGGRHALEAKYDLDNCLSCHKDAFADVICATCHGN